MLKRTLLPLACSALLGVQSSSVGAWASEPPTPTLDGRAFGTRESVPIVHELPSRLDLIEAVRLFREHGIDLLIADAENLAAEGDVFSAEAIPNPSAKFVVGHTINYTIHPVGEHGPEPCSGCSPINLEWDLSDEGGALDALSGKRTLRKELAGAALRSVRLGRRNAERVLVSALKQQYAAAAVARANFDWNKRLQESFAKTVEVSRQRFPGAIERSALARIELQKLDIDQSVGTAEKEARRALARLGYLLGVRGPIGDVEMDASVFTSKVPVLLEDATERTLTVRALANRPDLMQSKMERRRADAGLRLAQREQVPVVALSLGYNGIGYGQNAASPPFLAIGATADIPVFYQQQGEIRVARADLKAQALTNAKLEAQVVSDVAVAWSAYKTAHELLERSESTLVERAERMKNIVERQYSSGAISLTNFLDAERVHIEAERQRLRNLFEYWSAVFQLEEAIGEGLTS